MERLVALKDLRDLLDKYGLRDWSIRLNQQFDARYVGLCSHKDKTIILNAHHIDSHPEPEVKNTIRHELAHALVGPGHAHNETWQKKAREVGCDNVQPCLTYGLNSEVIDAIRSGADVKIEFETEVIRKPKYEITRLQDKCDTCGKVAITKSESLVEMTDFDMKFIQLECGHSFVKKIPKGTPFHKLYAYEDFEESIKNCKHEFDKNKCMKCGTFRPFPFQVEGMRFIEQALAVNKGAAIFDEMGLGKTIQALGYIKFHPEAWPVLYVIKSGIIYQWYQASATWLGPLFTGQIIKSSNDYVIPGLRSYFISYDLLIQKVRTNKKTGKVIVQGFDPQKLIDAGIKTMVLDECQQIKNTDSSRTQQVRKLARHMNVIALSGTPWKNRGSEFFSVLNMMAPMKFHSFEAFKTRWVNYYFDGKYTKEGGIVNPKAFKEYIKDLAIRRERTEVMKELPLINRMKLPVELSELEETEYSEAESKFVQWYNEQIINGEEPSGMNILAQMSRMRHLTGLAKIPATEIYVDDFMENEEKKFVIFVHHQDVGQILLENLSKKYPNKVKALTGGLDSRTRYDIQEWFNRTEQAILVASTLAAGEGLNLQTCADCILHEPQWNPQNEEQAEGRFIRIGQTADSVNATYVEADGTIDAHFGSIRERKRRQFHEAMNRGEQPTWNESELAKELAEKIVSAYNKKKKAKKTA